MTQQAIGQAEGPWRIPNPGGQDAGNPESWQSLLSKIQANFTDLYSGNQLAANLAAPPAIGGTTPAAGTFTTLAASSTVSGVGMTAFVKSVVAAQVLSTKQIFRAPAAADTTSSTPAIVTQVTPSNVALTIAKQPPQARKLLTQLILGNPGTTNITAGTNTLVYLDQDGNSVTDVQNLATAVSVVLKSSRACSKLISSTVAGYTASGSGTGNTIAIGQSNDFGIACGQGTVGNFAMTKCDKVTSTWTGGGTAVTAISVVPADDGVAGTVDTAARTYAPTTAPSETSTVSIDYEFTANFTLAA